jgi:transposase
MARLDRRSELSADRKASRPIAHLDGFVGMLQVDGYVGYRALVERNAVTLAFWWAHILRRFYELAAAGSAPIAREAFQRIASLYQIEAEIRGRGADERHTARQQTSQPILDDPEPWLRAKPAIIGQKTKLAEAARYALARWVGLPLHRRRPHRDRLQCRRTSDPSDRDS